MSSARELINAPGGSGGWLPSFDWTTLQRRITMNVRAGVNWTKMGSNIGKNIGWWLVTTAIITALPLTMEFNREIMAEEVERLTIVDAVENQGATPLQLQQAGLTSAVGPEVLKGQAGAPASE